MEELKETIQLLKQAYTDVRYEARKNSMISDGDYVKDGLLHCRLCNTPKETVSYFLGNKEIVPCLCHCEMQKRDAELQAIKDETKRIISESKKRECFSAKALWDYTFERCIAKDTLMYTSAVKFVENFDRMKEDGQGLLYFGSTGYGKTYIAASIANALIDKGYSCYMSTMADIAAIMSEKNTERLAFLRELNKYDLLVIDDLGAERDTSYMDELVYSVVDKRYHAHLPTVVTTNLSGDELRKPKEQNRKRILSRLYEMCIFVEVKGRDRRRIENKERYDKYKDILGLPTKEE